MYARLDNKADNIEKANLVRCTLQKNTEVHINVGTVLATESEALF